MPDVIVLQHHAAEGPAGIGDALQRRGIATRVVQVYRGAGGHGRPNGHLRGRPVSASARRVAWHGDVFDLPARAVRLASSELTEHQAFRYAETAYGLLFHLDTTRPQLEAMVPAFGDELASAGLSADGMLSGASRQPAGRVAIERAPAVPSGGLHRHSDNGRPRVVARAAERQR
jgi:hypothetical protein